MSVSVSVYSNGLVWCSTCAPSELSGDEVATEVNRENPSGLQRERWAISSDPTFRGGEPNPCACNDDPHRQHWLLNLVEDSLLSSKTERA